MYGGHKDVQDLNRGKPSFCGMRLMYARVISPKVGTMMANIIQWYRLTLWERELPRKL